jgi:hypothetical protein
MQPLRFTIPGEYWDSQIYQGRLYLFGLDGSLFAIDWDKVVAEQADHSNQRLAFACAFQRSDYLYGKKWSLFFEDDEIRNLLEKKIQSLSTKTLELTNEAVKQYRSRAKDNPMPFPHSDCIIYDQQMYVGSASGVSRSTCNKRTVGPISGRPVKIWDIPVNSLSASWNNLAIAAGSEGLWQFSLETLSNQSYRVSRNEEHLSQLSEITCSACDWNFFSIFGSSVEVGGYLASFTFGTPQRFQDDEDYSGRNYGQNSERVREFEELVSADDIFHSKGYSFGCKDKIYQASNGALKVARYKPWADTKDERIRVSEDIPISHTLGGVVSGSVTLFGAVIEFDDGLLVLASDGQKIEIPGEPVNWRAFPRSKHYANHLHVIYEDRLEIYSFNHDYFIDQKSKIMGFENYDSDF